MREDIELGIDGWKLLRAGAHEQGLALLEKSLELSNCDMNRVEMGVAYLFVGNLEGACRYLDGVIDDQPKHMDKYYQLAGVARWLMGQPSEAARIWRSGLRCHYTDGAGGVTTPLLLIFAAARQPNSFELAEARKLLEKAIARSWAKNWPGHIGRFVMGQMTEADLRRRCQGFHDLDTRTRHLMADFYIAVAGLSSRHHQEFQATMSKYVADLTAVDPNGKEWNCEYHLAKYESDSAAI